MMAFVEDHAGRAVGGVPTARSVDHHQRMVGDDEVGMNGSAHAMFDEAFAVMRAAGIDALAAPVGQRGGAVAAEQGGQPAGQVATDHVAILAIRRPARHQLRQDRRPAGKAALHRIFEIEQAEIIFPSLAHHHPATAAGGTGQAQGFAVELALQRLGIGRYPDRATCLFSPERGGGEITQSLADAGAGLGEQHVGPVAMGARRETGGGRMGIFALAGAGIASFAQQRGQALVDIFLVQHHRARGRAGGLFFPFGQGTEQAAFGLLRAGDMRPDQRCPGPAQAVQGLGRRPDAIAFRPVALLQGLHQRSGNLQIEGGDVLFSSWRLESQRMGETAGGRDDETGRKDQCPKFEQVEAVQFGIAQPLPGEWRIHQHHRGFGGERNGFAAREGAALAIGRRHPDAGMAGI